MQSKINTKPQIFLSHSGRDAEIAVSISNLIEENMANQGYNVEVFCTSEPQHRFYKHKYINQERGGLKKYLKVAIGIYSEKRLLKKYLREKVNDSFVFVSLLSSESKIYLSQYIKFELQLIKSSFRYYSKSEQLISYLPISVGNEGFDQLPEVFRTVQGLMINMEDKSHAWITQLTDYLINIIPNEQEEKSR